MRDRGEVHGVLQTCLVVDRTSSCSLPTNEVFDMTEAVKREYQQKLGQDFGAVFYGVRLLGSERSASASACRCTPTAARA